MAARKKTAQARRAAARKKRRARLAKKWKRDLTRANKAVATIHKALGTSRRRGEANRKELDIKMGDLSKLQTHIKRMIKSCFIPGDDQGDQNGGHGQGHGPK